jgi:hypothetical protein
MGIPDSLQRSNLAIQTLVSEVGPAEQDGDAGREKHGLTSDPPSHLRVVAPLGVLGDGHALEGVGLEAACEAADGAEEGELAAAGGASSGTGDDWRHFYWEFVWWLEVEV